MEFPPLPAWQLAGLLLLKVKIQAVLFLVELLQP
jgi:hypothetical protein